MKSNKKPAKDKRILLFSSIPDNACDACVAGIGRCANSAKDNTPFCRIHQKAVARHGTMTFNEFWESICEGKQQS